MNLNPEQILFITAILTPLITQALKLFLAWQGKELSRTWVTIAVFIISVALATFWWLPQIEPTQDPLQLVTSLLAAASTIVGGATLIYNLILQKLFAATSLTKSAILSKPPVQ